MKRLSPSIAIFVFGLGICVPAIARDKPIIPDMEHGDFGSNPANYKAQITVWAQTNLKDPDAAKYIRFSKPRKEWAVENLQPIYGWSACVTINGKNSYGAYTGAQNYWFFFQNGKIVRSQDAEEFGGMISIGHEINCDDG